MPARAQPAEEAAGPTLYERGVQLYEQGKYSEAVEVFQRAFQAAPAAGLLFNIAQAYRLWGPTHCVDAYNAYSRYLVAMPKAPNRREVEEHLATLKPCALALQQERSSQDRVEKPRVEARTLPWKAVGAGGLAAAAAGGVLYWQSWQKFKALQVTCAANPCAKGSFDGWAAATDVSYALLVAGGAAGVTALALGLRSPVLVMPVGKGVAITAQF